MRPAAALAAAIALGLAAPAASQSLPTWTITPAVSIESDGTPQTEFSRIAVAFRLADGRIAVANGATNDVRIFDAAGKYVRTFGRSGAGPGEFRRLDWVGRSGDTAYFYDSGLKRIMTVHFAAVPSVVQALPIQIQSDRGYIYVNGRLPDGRWMVETSASPTWDLPNGHRIPLSVGWIDRPAEGKINWVGKLPGMSIFAFHPSGSVGKGSMVGAGAFTPWVYAAASGPTMWFGDSFADSLIAVGANGQSSTVRLPLPRRRLTEQMIATARDAELERGREAADTASTRAKYSPANLPKDLPFFEALKPGPGGEVWVQEAAAGSGAAVRYLVLSAAGTPRAWVNTPAGVRLTDVGTDYAVAIHRDDDGVETVRVYRISRR